MVIEEIIDRLAKSNPEVLMIVRPDPTGEYIAASVSPDEVRYYSGTFQGKEIVGSEKTVYRGKDAQAVLTSFRESIGRIFAGPNGHLVSGSIRVIYYKGKNIDLLRLNTYGIDFVFDLPYGKIIKVDTTGKVRAIFI